MKIFERFENLLYRKCNVCRRPRGRAIKEQVDQLVACSVEHCPFHQDIFSAIREAQKAELLIFNLSESEALEGSNIKITWKTRNCRSVFITGHGEVAPAGEKIIKVQNDTKEFEIVLQDLFGETFRYIRPFRVLPGPSLEIIDFTDKIVTGEGFTIHYKAANYRSIYLRGINGEALADLSGNTHYSSPPISKDSKLLIHVEGRYGGQIKKEIEVKVFAPPVINEFKCDSIEKVDTLPVYFEFDFQHAHKAELFMNGILIADVTSVNSFTHIAENKTETVLFPRYELIVTGITGKIIKSKLQESISVYPQPSIFDLRASPDSIILFPKEITISNLATFCEYIIFSDGKTEKIIPPNASFSITPAENSAFTFRPIGKQNFHGTLKELSIEVFYPVELKVFSNRKITLPNVPVTISWESKNHTHIFIEPGNIDVTHKSFYEIYPENKTSIKVIAVNKRDREEKSVFVDVLHYQRVNNEIFKTLPKIDLHIPRLESVSLRVSKNPVSESIMKRNMPLNLSTKILEPLKQIIPKTDFDFQRLWRNRMFEKLKSLSQKEKEI